MKKLKDHWDKVKERAQPTERRFRLVTKTIHGQEVEVKVYEPPEPLPDEVGRRARPDSRAVFWDPIRSTVVPGCSYRNKGRGRS